MLELASSENSVVSVRQAEEGLCLAPLPSPGVVQWSVGSVSGYRLAVRRAGASDGDEPLGMAVAVGAEWLAISAHSVFHLVPLCYLP